MISSQPPGGPPPGGKGGDSGANGGERSGEHGSQRPGRDGSLRFPRRESRPEVAVNGASVNGQPSVFSDARRQSRSKPVFRRDDRHGDRRDDRRDDRRIDKREERGLRDRARDRKRWDRSRPGFPSHPQAPTEIHRPRISYDDDVAPRAMRADSHGKKFTRRPGDKFRDLMMGSDRTIRPKDSSDNDHSNGHRRAFSGLSVRKHSGSENREPARDAKYLPNAVIPTENLGPAPEIGHDDLQRDERTGHTPVRILDEKSIPVTHNRQDDLNAVGDQQLSQEIPAIKPETDKEAKKHMEPQARTCDGPIAELNADEAQVEAEPVQDGGMFASSVELKTEFQPGTGSEPKLGADAEVEVDANAESELDTDGEVELTPSKSLASLQSFAQPERISDSKHVAAEDELATPSRGSPPTHTSSNTSDVTHMPLTDVSEETNATTRAVPALSSIKAINQSEIVEEEPASFHSQREKQDITDAAQLDSGREVPSISIEVKGDVKAPEPNEVHASGSAVVITDGAASHSYPTHAELITGQIVNAADSKPGMEIDEPGTFTSTVIPTEPAPAAPKPDFVYEPLPQEARDNANLVQSYEELRNLLDTPDKIESKRWRLGSPDTTVVNEVKSKQAALRRLISERRALFQAQTVKWARISASLEVSIGTDEKGEDMLSQNAIKQPHNPNGHAQRHSREEEKGGSRKGSAGNSTTQPRRGRERSRAHGDVARSEAEFLEILANLEAQTARDPLIRARQTSAKIPDQHQAVEKMQFLSTNNLVTDHSFLTARLRIDGIDDFTPLQHEKFLEAYVQWPKEFGRIAAATGRSFNDCVLHYYRTKKEADYKRVLAQHTKRKRGRKPKRKVEDGRETGSPSTPTLDQNPQFGSPLTPQDPGVHVAPVIAPPAVTLVDVIREAAPIHPVSQAASPPPSILTTTPVSAEKGIPPPVMPLPASDGSDMETLANAALYETPALWTRSEIAALEKLSAYGSNVDEIAVELRKPVEQVRAYYDKYRVNNVGKISTPPKEPAPSDVLIPPPVLPAAVATGPPTGFFAPRRKNVPVVKPAAVPVPTVQTQYETPEMVSKHTAPAATQRTTPAGPGAGHERTIKMPEQQGIKLPDLEPLGSLPPLMALGVPALPILPRTPDTKPDPLDLYRSDYSFSGFRESNERRT